MTYTLFMTVGIINYNTGHTIVINTSTAEFDSEQACRYAGAQQELALRTDFQLNTSKYYTFICVPKGQ